LINKTVQENTHKLTTTQKQESCAIAKMTARYIRGSNKRLWRYGHSKFSKMAACSKLGFDVTGNSAIRYDDPENHTPKPNMKCIGLSLRRYGHSRFLGVYGTPFCGEGEVVGGQRWQDSKEQWWFPISSPLWQLRYL